MGPHHIPPTSPPLAIDAPPDRLRRALLVGFGATYVLSLLPFALAQEVPDAAMAPFMALSALLVGRTSLDTGQARRLHDALAANDAGFADRTRQLLQLIEQRKIDPMQLQQTLNDENSPLKDLPGQIVTAWYLGIVGSGVRARCIAFETALNAQIVADVLKPPTYAYGGYGSWSRHPAEGPDHG
ncbi:sorbitol dehydrogenase family protein [Kaistia sp. MMO-174]|uniref:sorbitol dehydrogenase family protein n=1 Tax=Kaistia sp. MMO-174 TaxID=3081256 RepID=UPI003019B2AF